LVVYRFPLPRFLYEVPFPLQFSSPGTKSEGYLKQVMKPCVVLILCSIGLVQRLLFPTLEKYPSYVPFLTFIVGILFFLFIRPVVVPAYIHVCFLRIDDGWQAIKVIGPFSPPPSLYRIPKMRGYWPRSFLALELDRLCPISFFSVLLGPPLSEAYSD